MIHIIVLVKKLDSITHEEFSEHWRNHGKLLTELPIAKQKIAKYTQTHIDQAEKAKLQALGLKTLDCDGVIHQWVEKLEDIFAVLGDAEFKAKIVPDEAKFVQGKEMVVAAGVDHEVF